MRNLVLAFIALGILGLPACRKADQLAGIGNMRADEAPSLESEGDMLAAAADNATNAAIDNNVGNVPDTRVAPAP